MAYNITVCASGGGGNFQALMEAQKLKNFSINLLIVDRECAAIERAIDNNIPYKLIEKKTIRPRSFQGNG